MCSNTRRTHRQTHIDTGACARTGTACRWGEQVSLANANWTGPWVSEPFCSPSAEVHRYILAEQISPLLEGTSGSDCTTNERLLGSAVKWRGTSEPLRWWGLRRSGDAAGFFSQSAGSGWWICTCEKLLVVLTGPCRFIIVSFAVGE